MAKKLTNEEFSTAVMEKVQKLNDSCAKAMDGLEKLCERTENPEKMLNKLVKIMELTAKFNDGIVKLAKKA